MPWKALKALAFPVVRMITIAKSEEGCWPQFSEKPSVTPHAKPQRRRCIIGTVLTDSAASLTASLEPSQLMAPVLSLVDRVI